MKLKTNLEVNNVLEKAGILHADKMRLVANSKDLESAASVFKTESSKSYQILDKSINSSHYKLMSKASLLFDIYYVGSDTYMAYKANMDKDKNILLRETISAGVGATADIVVGGISAHGIGLLGAVFGSPGGVVGGSLGYLAGASGAIIYYNYSWISNSVKNKVVSMSKTTWNFAKDHLHWG